MPINPAYTTTVASGARYYRITNPSFQTTDHHDHPKVVNGQGARKSYPGGRYNYGGALTVYVAETPETCFTEKMFYFHREILRLLDVYHITGTLPTFKKNLVLWEVVFDLDITDVFDMCQAGAASYYNVFLSMMRNPSQDYHHLKDRRSFIQSEGYAGLRAPSSRDGHGGEVVVLFDNQSGNVRNITPYAVEFRLITDTGTPYNNHVTDHLDFAAGQVRITSGSSPSGAWPINAWQKLQFNH